MPRTPVPDQKFVAGVDGCPGGWLVVLRQIDDASTARAQLFRTFAEILALPENPAIIAVDMPIGLPQLGQLGGRPADIEARANLGARQSAVFAVPSRDAVMQTEYRAACNAAFATSDPPRMVSKQCFYLFPKIREIDALMTPHLQDRVRECHPELSFWGLNGETPLTEPKKVKSRPHPPGLELRRGLLRAAGYDPAFLTDRTAFKATQVGPDDLLDACACSWSAARMAQGGGRRFPPDPPHDSKGLRMEIWG
jgi:predicted RNase H-like nuclease